MKRLFCVTLLLALLVVCVAASASAEGVLQRRDTVVKPDGLSRDPAAAIKRDCNTLGHNAAQIGFEEATCTEPGYYVLECTRCHKEWKEKAKNKLGHNYQYAQTNPALCESNGKEWFECTRCGDTQYQTIPKLGHDYRVTSTVDATCTKDGKKIYTCSRPGCGAQKSETIAANGKHKWVKDSFEEPDCGVKGTQYYYCSVCGDQKNESIPALEHNWQQVGVKEPTCGEKGAYYLRCRNCDRGKTEERAATGEHKWGLLKEIAPTCTSDGAKHYQCKNCAATKSEKVASAGHNWSIVSTVDATCDTPKIVKSECKKCGEKQEDKVGTAAGHNWKDGQIIKQPTCTEDGKASSVCERCGKTDSARTLAKLGHSYGAESVTKAATCTAAGEKQATCKTCGDVKKTTIKATGHSYGDWKVTKEATEKAEGKQERTCKTCNQTESQTIPKKVKPTPTPKPTKTPKPTATPKYYNMMEDGQITIVSTSGKVNLRTGPGKKNSTAGQVAKSNTNLGTLIEAQADSTGTVWYKVHYNKKNVWITSQYARAVIGDMTYSDDRHVGVDSVDMSDICFDYISEAADHYGLDLDMSGEASNNELSLSGSGDFVETIEICGEGYALYGIEVGDKLKTVENSMKKNGLYCASKSGGVYVYKRPIQPYSMCVNDEGFDSYVEVVLDESKCVESIRWNAYTE